MIGKARRFGPRASIDVTPKRRPHEPAPPPDRRPIATLTEADDEKLVEAIHPRTPRELAHKIMERFCSCYAETDTGSRPNRTVRDEVTKLIDDYLAAARKALTPSQGEQP